MRYLLLRCSRLVIPVAIMITFSCYKDNNTDFPETGFLELNCGISMQVQADFARLKAADPDTFSVDIRRTSGELFLSFVRALEIPDLLEMPEGEYTVEAFSRNNLPAAFDNPSYRGESDPFSIVSGDETQITVVCRLANVMVSVIYSDNIRNGFSSWSATVSNEHGSLIFDELESRIGYFDQGPVRIEVNLFKDDGTGNTETKSLGMVITDALPGMHYEIHVDAAPGGGSATIGLELDESAETEIVFLNDSTTQGPIAYGDLLISEIMFNPSALSDTDGEYIELLNTTDDTINLNQLVIVRESTGSRHVIDGDIAVAPGNYALLARTGLAAESVDYIYGSSISLPNSGEALQIENYGNDGTDGSIICRVDYGISDFPSGQNGASIQLSDEIRSVNQAMLGISWCESTTAFITGDLGTPGSKNGGCP